MSPLKRKLRPSPIDWVKMVGSYSCKRRTRRWPVVLWCNVLDVATLSAYTRRLEGTPHLQYHITEVMGRCVIKKKHSPTQPQVYIRQKSIEEEEVQDLPSCQRQRSQQLVFSVRPVCKEHKPVVVVKHESSEMVLYLCDFISLVLFSSIRSHSLQFITVALQTFLMC